jgi:uncharacterized protein
MRLKQIVLLIVFVLLGAVVHGQINFEETKAKADSGDAEAQNSLGVYYFMGFGGGDSIELAWEKAVYWFTKSAEQGHATAQYGLGLMYDKGEGVTQDKEQALYWYTKSAEQGKDYAQYRLGEMHYYGEGTVDDRREAAYWIKKAYENGHEGAEIFWNEHELWQYEGIIITNTPED